MAAIWNGNDGIGTAYIGLLAVCNQNASSVGSVTVMNADLSDPSNMVPYTIENSPVGDLFVVGFFDDNENADPMNPTPDMGDIVLTNDAHNDIGCVPVHVADTDVTGADVVFNFTLPVTPP